MSNISQNVVAVTRREHDGESEISPVKKKEQFQSFLLRITCLVLALPTVLFRLLSV